MKIHRLDLVDHPFFGTTSISFTDSDGRPAPLTVFAGINGSGKTTVLMKIYQLLRDGVILREGDLLRISEPPHSTEHSSLLIELDAHLAPFADYLDASLRLEYFYTAVRSHWAENPSLAERFRPRDLPKCVFLPSEINFNRVLVTNEPYRYESAFINVIEESFAQVVPNYFATFIDRMVYENDGVPAKVSIDKACAEINRIFENLDVEARLIGLKKDGTRMPVFRNRLGKSFEVNGLSSGEKQLFFRIMALKMIEANHSILLVDEPEISLHPAWQQKILAVYEHVGKDNQVLVATHSPHVIASTAREHVKVLSRSTDNAGIRIVGMESIPVALGAPAERILTDLMGLATTRDPDIQERIDALWQDVFEERYGTDDFARRFDALEKLLGTYDDDLAMMKLEMGRKLAHLNPTKE